MNLATTTLFLFLSFLGFSQTDDDEGYLKFNISIEAVDTSLKVRQMAANLRNSSMEIYYSDGNTRVDFIMGTSSSTTIIVNRTEEKVLSLMKTPVNRQAALISSKDYLESQPQVDSSTVVTDLKQTKTILGYKCTKYKVTSNNINAYYWCTNEFSVNIEGVQFINPNLPGFPLAFSQIKSGVRMYYQASNYRTSLSNKDALFSVEVPEGYVEVKSSTEK